jgi:hypothetical protein
MARKRRLRAQESALHCTSKLFEVLTNFCDAKAWLATAVERTRSFVSALECTTNLGLLQAEGWVFDNYLVVRGWKASIFMGPSIPVIR